MKIAIFGGTFDPPHNGHLKIVMEATKKFDKVIVVPTICNYYRPDKRYLFTFDEKVSIWKEMLCGLSGSVDIDTIEKGQDSKWRFINTLEYFHKKFPKDELYVIIGEDSYKDFKTWFRFDDILNLAKLVVVQRGNGNDIAKDVDIPYEPLEIGDAFLEASSTKIRDKLISEIMDMYMADREFYV